MKIVPKIDIHVHAIPRPFILSPDGDRNPTPPELRRIYDSVGIEKGVLLPEGPYAHGGCDITSGREAADLVRDFPETLGWWFCGVSPALGKNSPDMDLSVYIRQYKALGAKGVGEIEENRYFDDPYMLNLFRHCEACDMPVLFHIGNLGGDYGLVDEPGLPRLEKVLGMFPRLKFFGHSQKFWAEIGVCDPALRNDYPTGPVTPGRVVELMRRYPNLCGDLSAGSGANALMRDPEFAYGFLEEFSDRLYFGTDICSPNDLGSPMLRLSGFLDDAMQKGKISYETYERVSRGNALDLLER